jgi:hypothetical protein
VHRSSRHSLDAYTPGIMEPTDPRG